jgi:WhiB family transcriptional regulator, redox-sensing transcriptional regulator
MHLADARSSPSKWRGGAACLNHDPDLFFPEGTAGPALLQVDRAKQVCQSCPVLAPCLGFALRHGEAFGIWGGATAEERRQGAAGSVPGTRTITTAIRAAEIWAARSRRALLVDWGGMSDHSRT